MLMLNNNHTNIDLLVHVVITWLFVRKQLTEKLADVCDQMNAKDYDCTEQKRGQ